MVTTFHSARKPREKPASHSAVSHRGVTSQSESAGKFECLFIHSDSVSGNEPFFTLWWINVTQFSCRRMSSRKMEHLNFYKLTYQTKITAKIVDNVNVSQSNEWSVIIHSYHKGLNIHASVSRLHNICSEKRIKGHLQSPPWREAYVRGYLVID